MIRVEIDGKPLETILENTDKEIKAWAKEVNRLLEYNKKLTDNIDQLYEKVELFGNEIIKLQEQIIAMKTEDAKERKSFWDFLKSNKPKEEEAKHSRIKKSTVTLTK